MRASLLLSGPCKHLFRCPSIFPRTGLKLLLRGREWAGSEGEDVAGEVGVLAGGFGDKDFVRVADEDPFIKRTVAELITGGVF
jgi:hypothetical protein